jgi:hypothetical protein
MQIECPLLAQSGHARRITECPLLGAKRTFLAPKRHSGSLAHFRIEIKAMEDARLVS